MKIKQRLLQLKLPSNRSAFLWGPRKVGKTYWITHTIKNAIYIDLLKTDVFAEYASRPALLRERYQRYTGSLIVIDEVQKIPQLLDEVHWLIENQGLSFLLTGSSARKLRRGQANLLGGRAWRRNMRPLSYLEVTGFNLERVMTTGLLPPHYLSPQPVEDLRGYVADYLKEEVAAEALTQNIPAFSEFLRVAAITSSELINYINIARETGISHKVVRTYFNILEDTYLGFRVSPWKKSKNRRMITTEKFYLFDVGVANYLARRQPRIGSAEFGKSFEHYILMELKAYQAYKKPDLPITFWRTSTGREVDFILGDKDIAIEIKGASDVHEADIRSLLALIEDGPVKKCCVVCREREPRWIHKNIEVLPWQIFIERLWNEDFC
ncbi:MAG: AAA family ATPase [Candidatus Omnitrophica bacterium]|nr:AAA family ATPase [Candidatus Omnitrophota bacterium]MBU0878880.1 AAA family ATPase [Candidatus Omnitrophota bacterium]MBU1134117.1 AAA family ATPase [Candidatus Omnitrophota bacterium]MBU1810098.1 AAA family ATPase [Candidatus Omnitrophota bacterium]